MDSQDIRKLKILEEIGNDSTQSQRDLSRKLNISLGLVNSFVRRLANKGYFKIATFPKNRVKYILTPKGASEKSRLTYQYIQYSIQFYKSTRKSMRKLFGDLMSQGVRSIVFYGVSEFTEIAYISLQETSIKLLGIVDEKKSGKIFLGKMVSGLDSLDNISFDRILITSINAEYAVIERLLEKGIVRNKIVINGDIL